MAAYSDYLDLRLAVSEKVGNRAISDVFPRLVQSAEAMLNTKLRHRKQLTDATLTFASGVATLPTDFLEMLHVYDAQSRVMRQVTISQTKLSGSQYQSYAIDDASVYIYGLTGDRDCTYYAKLSTLTTSLTTSNWLLATYPAVYLYAVGVEAANFLNDPDKAMECGRMLVSAMGNMKVDDDRARYGDGVVRVQGVTP